MKQERIDRISELTRISRERELTESEKKERQELREEFIKSMKASLVSNLESTYIVDEEGNKKKLTKKLEGF